MPCLFPYGAFAALLGALPSLSQDVAAPSMPEVDDYRRTPEFARGREAVARYMFFWILCGRIAILESAAQGKVNGGILAGRMLNLLPENSSAGCPEAFRKVWTEPLKKIKTALNENPEWGETPEGKRQMREMGNALKYLKDEYGAGRMADESMKWLNKWLADRKQNAPEAVLKEMLQLKKDLESEKVAVPSDILRSGAGEEAGD